MSLLFLEVNMNSIIINGNRDFKGIWIDRQIYQDINLSRTEKDCLVEIINLCQNGKCFATNRHFAEFLGITKGTAANIIYGLRKKGYIKVNIKRKDNKEIEERTIEYLDPYSQKNEYPYSFYNEYPIHKKMKEKNTKEEYNIEEYNNIDNIENIPADAECPSVGVREDVEINMPDIEDVKSQWHWKSEKQYNDYLGKVMIKYLWNIAHRRRKTFEDQQFYVDFWERLIKMYFKYYRINTGEWHPWYTEEMLEKKINMLYAFGLNVDRKRNSVNQGCFEDYVQRFFKIKQLRGDYTFAVFANERMLTGLYGDICQDYNVFEELKEEFV